MSQISLYFDEDAMDHRLVTALRARGVRVVTVLDTGSSARSDEDQISIAVSLGCAVYTFNVPDFHRIHRAWMAEGREHMGSSWPDSNNSQSANSFAGYCVSGPA